MDKLFQGECRHRLRGPDARLTGGEERTHGPCFVREFGNETIVCVFYFSHKPTQHDIRTDRTAVLLHGHGFDAELQQRILFLPAAGAAFLRLE